MDPTLLAALSDQITRERTNAALYAGLALGTGQAGWRGSSHWFVAQAHDEQDHALQFTKYLSDRNLYTDLGPIPAVPVGPPDLLSAFVQAYQVEQETTEGIRALYYLAEQVEDAETCTFLQAWLLDQMQEEREVLDILQDLRHVETCPAGALMIDRELGKR